MYRILVVDDEVVITMQLEERLTGMGYEVVGRAASGEASVDMARRLRPELVLMDIVMPGKSDGIDAAETIRAELDIPVIFLTAYANDEFVERAKAVEPFAYIVKPFQEREIAATIEVALYRKDMERRLRESEEALRRYASRLKALHEIDQAILAARSPEVAAEVALCHIRQLVPCQGAGVTLFDFECQEATLVVFATDVNGKFEWVPKGTRLSLDGMEDSIEELRQGQTRVEDDLALSKPLPVIQALQAVGARSLINVPLIAQGELIGSLNLAADSPGVFTAEHVEVAREVANLLAIAIQQARLHEQAQWYTAEKRRLVNVMAEHEMRMTELEDTIRELRDQLRASGKTFLADDPLAPRMDDVEPAE